MTSSPVVCVCVYLCNRIKMKPTLELISAGIKLGMLRSVVCDWRCFLLSWAPCLHPKNTPVEWVEGDRRSWSACRQRFLLHTIEYNREGWHAAVIGLSIPKSVLKLLYFGIGSFYTFTTLRELFRCHIKAVFSFLIYFFMKIVGPRHC